MQDTVTRCLGLVTQYNPLTVGKGALSRADDVVITRENIIEPRRGRGLYFSLSSVPSRTLVYDDVLIAQYGNKIAYDNSGAAADYSGTYSPPSGVRMNGVEAQKNFYFTTDQGIQVLQNQTGTAARLAGVPRALDPSYTLTGSSGFLANNYQCAYRVMIERTDLNDNVLRGYPSQRLWVVNAAGASRNTSLTIYLNTDINVGDYLNFYRTTQVSGTSSDDSGDEMGLIYQHEVTSSNISAGYVTITDNVVDDLRGETLYTSPSQEGIAQANDRPPLAKDIALYRDQFMIFSNLETKQRLFTTLVGTTGLAVNDQITIAGTTYTFKASENAAAGEVKISSTGVAAVDIDVTARSLVSVINRYATNTTVYAFYLSGPEDLPGQIMIEERVIGGAAFQAQAQAAGAEDMFFPPLPIQPATSDKTTSSNAELPNFLAISKPGELEAVPIASRYPVGPRNKAILRIAPLQSSLIIIKEEGVYRLSGNSASNFEITPVDLTVSCKAPNSVVVLQNQVFMLSNQGVVAISENGVEVVSRDIEPNIKKLLTITTLDSKTAAAAYESERFYLLSVPTISSDTGPNQTYVLNVFTKTWTRWRFGILDAVVNPAVDKLFMSIPGASAIYRERKDFDDSDYADPEISITIMAINDDVVDFSIASGAPERGWAIKQGDTYICIGTPVPIAGGWRATMDFDPPASWTTGAANIFPNVGYDIQWMNWTAGAPGMVKQASICAIFADSTPTQNTATKLSATFTSNYDEDEEELDLLTLGSAWGSGAWGEFAWGGGGDPYAYACVVPRNKQYCTRLNVGVRHYNAFEKLSIGGFGLEFTQVSERIGK